VLLAGCQPLPHPFADDLPPPSLMRVRSGAAVTIAPIDGVPQAAAAKLESAIAHALQEHDIAATDKATSLGSYQLYGRIEELPGEGKKASLVAYWRLRDPNGQPLGERSERVDGTAQEFDKADDGALAKLASASAEQLAGLLQEEAPVQAAAPGHTKTRLLIGKIAGAPGDGGQSLATAMANVLRRQDIDVVVQPEAKADLSLDAEVTAAAAKSGKQDVKIVWHVRRGDGGEIGTVGQENEVPSGLLNGPWGDLAYMVALSAQDGIMALVARAVTR